jgi:hypothetical protein
LTQTQKGKKMKKAIDQIRNTKGIFQAEKINRLARYIANTTGLDMQIATKNAQILL